MQIDKENKAERLQKDKRWTQRISKYVNYLTWPLECLKCCADEIF